MISNNDNLPVGILYDRDKIDENANIEPALVVPLGTARTRSQNDHEIGARLYKQVKEKLAELHKGTYRGIPIKLWKERAPNYDLPTIAQLENELRILSIENPDKPGENHIDRHIRNVLRGSAGIKGFRSIQATQSLSARNGSMVHGEGGASLQGNQHQQLPTTTVQIAVGAAKDVGRESVGPVRKYLGLNGK